MRRSVTLRSDVLVVLIVLIPLLVLVGVGAVSVLAQRPAWLLPTQNRALAALLVATLLSWMTGVAPLTRLRAYQRLSAVGAWGSFVRTPVQARGWTSQRLLTAHRALLVLPLWRGPARRTGRAMALGSGLALVAALLPWSVVWSRVAPQVWPWCLAILAVVALVAATRIKHLALLETAVLLESCKALPIDVVGLRRAASALGLMPLAVGLLMLLPALAWATPSGLRPGVFVFWFLACSVACGFEVFVQQSAAANKSARWWFSLIVCVAVSTEVLA